MAETLTDLFNGTLTVRMQFQRVDTQEVGSVTNKVNTTTAYQLVDGVESQQADIVYADTRTILANSLDSIDFSSLQQDTLEVAVPLTFGKLRLIRVVNHAAHLDGYVYFGADPINPNRFAFAIGPSSELLSINHKQAWDVSSTNGTVHLFNPSTLPVNYSIYAIGSA